MKKHRSIPITVAAAAALAVCMAGMVHAGALERAQARRIHDRLAGVPPSAEILDLMEQDILGDPVDGAVKAAWRAIETRTFYTTVLKNWITPWTNREQTVFAP